MRRYIICISFLVASLVQANVFEDIKKGVEKAGKKVKETAEDVGEEVKEGTEKAQEEAKKAKEKAEEEAKKAKKKAEEEAKKAKKKAEEEAKKAKEKAEKAAKKAKNVFAEDVKKFFEQDVPNAFEKAGDKIEASYKKGWDATKKTFEEAAKQVGGELGKHWDKVVKHAEETYGASQDGAGYLHAVFDQQKHHIQPAEVQEAFQEPADNVRFNQAMFLGGHNGYAYSSIYKLYYQHEEDIETQFKFGIRSFELDTYDYKGDVYLCHRKCEGPRAFAITGSKNPDVQKFTDVLKKLNNLLDDNPQSVIMMYLENKADPKNVAKAIEQVPDLKNKLLVPNEDWTLDDHDGHWPELGWMRKNNKRAVLFSTNFEGNKYAWRLWDDAKENYCCTTDLKKLCEARGPSGTYPRFYFMKYFDKMTATFDRSKKLHSKERMQKAIDKCAKEGIKDTPNVILIDRSESVMDMWNKGEPSIMDIINQHNKQQAEANKKAEK